jgi:hypothetical protein
MQNDAYWVSTPALDGSRYRSSGEHYDANLQNGLLDPPGLPASL